MYKSLENIHTINMYDINIFLTYSILGFFYECIINFIQDGRFSSGFMYGPWTPIYGIGVLIILYIYKKLKKYTKIKRLILLSIISMIILTVLEYIIGNLVETLFNQTFWDYSKYKFNYGKFISLESSLIWMIGSIIIIFIHKKLKKYIKKIPNQITIILSIVFTIDLVLSVIRISSLK